MSAFWEWLTITLGSYVNHNKQIISVANKTDWTDSLIQSNFTKAVYVYDASKESWNRSDDTTDWYNAANDNFPDKVYLLLTEDGLDIIDASDTENVWMGFEGGTNNAIDGNDFTSVYALDGRIYAGSDKGLYVLDFANDNITKYNSTDFSTFDTTTQFYLRNAGTKSYFPLDGTKELASDGVNDVHANRVRGEYLVAVATDGDANGAVNIINLNDLNDVDDDTIAELDFNFYDAGKEEYSADSVFIANDGTLYYSENRLQSNKGNTKLSFKYSIDTYTGTDDRADEHESYLSKASRGSRSEDYPHFLSEFINDVYVASGKSRAHLLHNMIYVATENGVSVIQEIQSHEGSGTSKNYGYTGSTNSDIDYKVLDGSTDNFTAVTARSDGNEMYVGNNDGNGGGWVSKISLSSNTLVDYWNSTSDTSIVGEDITSLDFLDGDLLVGTLSNGATQLVEEELDHYLITDYTNHRVVEIDNTGLIHWEFGIYGVASNETNYLTHPTYAVRHDDGNYLIADSGNRRILEISPDKEVIQVITNATQLSDATSFGEVYSIQKIG